MQSRRVQFPYVLGRELHDQAATLFPEKTRLNNTESVKLLSNLPQGVFQMGRSTVGPFGCVESEHFRQLPSARTVPGYLCDRKSCSDIHQIDLETLEKAPINRALKHLGDYVLEYHNDSVSKIEAMIADEVSREMRPWAHTDSGGLMNLLSDGLDNGELRSVANVLLRQEVKEGLKNLGTRLSMIIMSPSEVVESLSRSQVHQLLLQFSDEQIMAAIDEVIDRGELRLEEYEQRVSRIERWATPRRLKATIGVHGVQLRERGSGGAAITRRLLELLHAIYFASKQLEPADLAYTIESDVSAGQGLLSEAVSKMNPEELMRSLVFGDRRSAELAKQHLGMSSTRNYGRDETVERALWKIGVPTEVLFKDVERISRHSAELSAGIEASDSEEVLRGHVSNLFNAVEDALQRALQFSTWALGADHYTSPDGFVYDPTPNGKVFEFIDLHRPTSNAKLQLSSAKNTIVPLAAGFSRLAHALRGLNRADYVRPVEDLPTSVRLDSRPFAFSSTILFLDLEKQAQEVCIEALESVGRAMSDETVLKVRNSVLHGNNPFPSSSEMNLAANLVRDACDAMLASGIYPTVFTLATKNSDNLGRQELNYAAGEQIVRLSSPQWPLSPRMPFSSLQMVMMPAARLQAAGPLRFSLKARPGPNPYWQGYPQRWKVASPYGDIVSSVESDEVHSLESSEVG